LLTRIVVGLVKAVLTSIVTYFISVLDFPMEVLLKIFTAIWLPGAYAPGFFEKSEQIENLSKKIEKNRART
jgi:hypothetical protein